MAKASSADVLRALSGVIEIPKNVRKVSLTIEIGEPVVATIEYLPESALSSGTITFDTTTISGVFPKRDDDIPPGCVAVTR